MSFVYFQATEYDLIERARNAGRYDQLGGYDGCRSLFEYYSEISEGDGEPIQLDIIGLCCDWTHYKTLWDASGDYMDPSERNDALDYGKDEAEEIILDYFRDNTTVIELDNGEYLIQAF